MAILSIYSIPDALLEHDADLVPSVGEVFILSSFNFINQPIEYNRSELGNFQASS